jgi:hypothetical protein
MPVLASVRAGAALGTMLSLPGVCIPSPSDSARIRARAHPPGVVFCTTALGGPVYPSVASRTPAVAGVTSKPCLRDEYWPPACLIADPHARDAREWHALDVDSQSTARKQLQLFDHRGAQHLGRRDVAGAHAHNLQSRAPQHRRWQTHSRAGCLADLNQPSATRSRFEGVVGKRVQEHLRRVAPYIIDHHVVSTVTAVRRERAGQRLIRLVELNGAGCAEIGQFLKHTLVASSGDDAAPHRAARAYCTASLPVTPVAPSTRTRSPVCSRARQDSVPHAEMPGFKAAAAAASSTSSAMGRHHSRFTAARSAMLPAGEPNRTRVPSGNGPAPLMPHTVGSAVYGA